MTIPKINEFLRTNDGNYLEIGVYYGDTFFEIAKSNPSKQIYGIDPFISDGWTGQKRGEILSEAERKCYERTKDCSNVYIFKQTSKQFHDMLTTTKSKTMNISIVFIDGSHWHENVQIDCGLAMELIGNKPGFIIFDDLNLHGVREAIKEAVFKYPTLRKIDGPSYMDVGGFYSVN